MEKFMLTILVAAVLMALQLPLMIRLFHKLSLLDKPDARKTHKQAIPAIGGLVIGLVWLELILIFPSLRQAWSEYLPIALPLLALCITGVWDDQRHLSSGIRFLVQISCAIFLVINGITIGNLGGIFGIYELPFWFDAIFTVIVITGVTNAFNLIDGIDGLAGGIALINLLFFGLFAYFTGSDFLMHIVLVWAVLVFVFLQFNWSPAKVFMGDGGSLVFGFFFIAMGLKFRQELESIQFMNPAATLGILSALLMVPVTDTLRVFAFRISQGRSPYSADRNHLHHWIVRNQMPHHMATLQIIILHAFLLPVTNVLLYFEFSLLTIVLSQFFIVLSYTKLIQAITNFNRWYRFIRRYEMNRMV